MTHNGTSKVQLLAWVLDQEEKNKKRKQAYDKRFPSRVLQDSKLFQIHGKWLITKVFSKALDFPEDSRILLGTVFCKRAAGGSNPFAVVKPENKNKYKGKPSYKISTAGKVHLVYLLANIAKFKNRKEVP